MKSVEQFIKYYLPIFLWMGMIFLFSSLPDLKVGASSLAWEIILRKAGHIGEYAVLLWLVWRAAFHGWNLVQRDAVIVALSIVSLYAVSDEIHQTFVPGRAGKAADIAIDVLSAFLSLQFIFLKYMARIRKQIILIILIIILTISAMEYRMIASSEKIVAEQNTKIAEAEKASIEEEKQVENATAVVGPSPAENKSLPASTNIPAKIKISVPFTSQAPLGVWDAYHEEACEEASIIMVKYYLDGQKLTPDTAEKEIQIFIKYEIENTGGYKDSNAEQMVKLAHDYYHINNMKVVNNFKREDLKKYLAQGKPIILPMAGRLLGNPNYKAPGPPYHVLVAIGYDGDNIITNDPGTRNGEGYVYNINVFYNAIHDFPGNLDNMEQGQKAMLVLE